MAVLRTLSAMAASASMACAAAAAAEGANVGVVLETAAPELLTDFETICSTALVNPDAGVSTALALGWSRDDTTPFASAPLAAGKAVGVSKAFGNAIGDALAVAVIYETHNAHTHQASCFVSQAFQSDEIQSDLWQAISEVTVSEALDGAIYETRSPEPWGIVARFSSELSPHYRSVSLQYSQQPTSSLVILNMTSIESL